MNLFVLDEDPVVAAHMVCDKHAGKMAVEGMQCLVSALLISDAPPKTMPVTSKGEPHKGGYHNHPVVHWAAECWGNFRWLYDHTIGLCETYEQRYGKEHAVKEQLDQLIGGVRWSDYIPHVASVRRRDYLANMTPFVRCLNLDLLDEESYSAVEAYREFYYREKRHFAKWDKGVASPHWWDLKEREEV
jgi:hypothetical protein